MCSTCLKPFTKKQNLLEHQKTERGHKPYKCSKVDCMKTFTKMSERSKHEISHSQEKPFACHYEHCEKKFKCSSSRAKHVKIIHQNNKIKCFYCDNLFSTKQSMFRHFKSKHLLEGFICAAMIKLYLEH